MTVETLQAFIDNGNPALPVIIATKGEDGVLRIAKTDPATGALLIAGTLEVEIPAPPAPEGGATEDKQDAQIVLETSIDGKLPALVGGKIPVDATISGIATEAKQDTGNSSLSSIDGKFTTLNAKDFATTAKQDTGNSSLSSIDSKITACNTGAVTISAALPAGTNAIGKLAANSGVDIGDVDVTSLPALPAGTNVIGKTGYQLVQVSANFTRPSDTTAYTIGDAVTNSTSAPVVFQLDLGALGAVNGQGIEIRKLTVVSSVKQATLPLFNVFLSRTTFTATNDNSALDIDDTTMQANGAWFICDVQTFTASNSRVDYLSNAQAMVLAAADTKLYGTIQAANAYVPVSGEVFYILAWVALL